MKKPKRTSLKPKTVIKTNGKERAKIVDGCIHFIGSNPERSYANLLEENRELKQWKRGQMEMTMPILEYMHKNTKKFNLQIGDSIFKKVLEILKNQ